MGRETDRQKEPPSNSPAQLLQLISYEFIFYDKSLSSDICYIR